MRQEIITKNIYQYDELNDTAKDNVLIILGELDYEWWDYVYEDANNIGLKITSFDCDRGEIEVDCILYAEQIADKILSDHGESCETYQDAKNFKEEIGKLKEPVGVNADDYDNLYNTYEIAVEEAENEFLHDLKETYLVMLRKTAEHLQSEEAIKENIEANGYEFDEKGNLA